MTPVPVKLADADRLAVPVMICVPEPARVAVADSVPDPGWMTVAEAVRVAVADKVAVPVVVVDGASIVMVAVE